MNEITQVLTGTLMVGTSNNSNDIIERVREAGRAYFGDTPIITSLYIREIRTIANVVMGYEVDYTVQPESEIQY